MRLFFAAALSLLVSSVALAANVPECSKEHMLYPYRSYEVFQSGDPKLDEQYADNMVTWQLDTGGWGKEGELRYTKPYVSGPKSGWRNKSQGVETDLGT